MIDAPRARDSLEKLLKLARADIDTLRIDLADIEQARQTADSALVTLDETVLREEAVMKQSGGVDHTGYFESARNRRVNLQTTSMTLADSEEETRSKLEAAFIELKKLEHLIEINERARKKTADRKDAGAMDEIASARKRVS